MVGMFVSLCLASQKSSDREFFISAVTDLGVKLLMYSYQKMFATGNVEVWEHIASEMIHSSALTEWKLSPGGPPVFANFQILAR
jgi:hypothetical protein